MKKLVSLLLVLMLVLSLFLVGCSGSKVDNSQGSDETKEPGTATTSPDQSADEEPDQTTEREMLGNMYLEGFPIVKEKVTIRIAAVDHWSSPDYNTKKVIQDYEEKTNIHVEWDQIPGSEADIKVNLMFATRDLPDAIFALPVSDLAEKIDQGFIIPLDELIEKYAPNIKKAYEQHPKAKQLVTYSDGRMYRLAAIDYTQDPSIEENFQINKKWLETLNLEVPTTTEELYTVLKAFKDNAHVLHPQGNIIPLTVVWGHNVEGARSMFGAWGTATAHDLFFVKDGKNIIVSTMEPGYKDAVKFFHRLYSEGLLDEECFTHDVNVHRAKTNEEPFRVGAWTSWGGWNAVGSVEKAKEHYTQIPVLKGPEGKQGWFINNYAAFAQQNNFITSGSKNPEIVIRWIDGLYDPEEAILWDRGPMGINLDRNAEGKIQLLPTPEDMGYGQFRIKETFVFPPKALTKDWIEKNYVRSENDAYKAQLNDMYRPYANMERLGFFPYTLEQQEALSNYSTYITELHQFSISKEAEWIINGNIDDEYDWYLEEIRKMYVEEIKSIHQEALDAFNSRQ
ncbi:MAG TPA: extracellular solute-binding protein [Clostridiales bacterium]|nr:extracellular solute-binding protein [Clostridiales bacterium]